MTSIGTTPVHEVDPFTDAKRCALPGFLSSYGDPTRTSYASDRRVFAEWCHTHHRALFTVGRADIELFARYLESLGRARSTIARRLVNIPGQ